MFQDADTVVSVHPGANAKHTGILIGDMHPSLLTYLQLVSLTSALYQPVSIRPSQSALFFCWKKNMLAKFER